MAQKKKAPSKGEQEASESGKVTRIKATDTRSSSKNTKTSSKKDKAVTAEKTTAVKKDTPKVKEEKRTKNPLRALGGYFKGAWEELRQVRWPNRRTTWGLTLAVIFFTVFFVLLIVLLDFVFQWIFDKVLLG